MTPEPPLPASRAGIGHVVALGVVCLFVVFALRTRLNGNVWSDVAFGQWMLANGKLPEQEPLSQISPKRDVPFLPCWLSQLILGAVCEGGSVLAGGEDARQLEGGAEMLRLLHGVLTLAFALLLLAAYRRRCGSLPLACLGLVLVACGTPPSPGPLRSEVFGLVCFALLLRALSRPVVSVKALLLLPFLFVLWINLHASFVAGLLLVGVCFLSRVIEVLLDAGLRDLAALLRDAQVVRLLLLLPLIGWATLLNPRGVELFPSIIAMIWDLTLAAVPEWYPLDFNNWGPTHSLFLGSLVLLALTQAASPKSFTLTQLMIVGTFGLIPLFQARYLAWWYPLLPWLLLPHWSAIADRKGWQIRPGRQPWPHTRCAALAVTVVFLIWLLPLGWLWRGPRSLSATVSSLTPWRVALQLREEAGSERTWLPGLAARLKASYPEGRFTGVIFTTRTTGDFLVKAVGETWPVYMYSQVQFYFGYQAWFDYLAIRKPEPDWWEILDRRGVNLIVVDRRGDAALAAVLPKDAAWEIVEGEETGPLLAAIRKKPFAACGQAVPSR